MTVQNPYVQVPYVRGSETSEAAAEAKQPTAGSDEARVLAYITSRDDFGATDDEIEKALDMRHQNASARRNALVRKGKVQDSGRTRLTRSGRKASVWTLGEGVPLDGAPNDRVARPSKEELLLVANQLEATGFSMDVAKWLRWIARH